MWRILQAVRRDCSHQPTYRTELPLEILCMFQVQIFDYPQGQRVGLQNLRFRLQIQCRIESIHCSSRATHHVVKAQTIRAFFLNLNDRGSAIATRANDAVERGQAEKAEQEAIKYSAPTAINLYQVAECNLSA